MLYPNKKSHILWCYTQIKKKSYILWCYTHYLIYTQIKNPKHPHEKDRDIWLEVDWWKRSGFEADGGLGMRLISGLGWLVGRWHQASVTATSRAGGGKQSELTRPKLKEWAWERWASNEMRVNERERHGVIKEWKKEEASYIILIPDWNNFFFFFFFNSQLQCTSIYRCAL